ncbi:MAG: PH domain-containing protein [Eubacteriales bacterium]|nr:PH domain-containing protein [Eubacteriales bacterium]
MNREIIWQDRKRTIFGLPLSFTKYELTKDRLLIRTGLLTTKEEEVRLYRILDVALQRTLGQRIFGVGSIRIQSSDRTAGDFTITSIKRSQEVKEMLSEMVEQERDSKRVVNREIMGFAEDEEDDVLN